MVSLDRSGAKVDGRVIRGSPERKGLEGRTPATKP